MTRVDHRCMFTQWTLASIVLAAGVALARPERPSDCKTIPCTGCGGGSAHHPREERQKVVPVTTMSTSAVRSNAWSGAPTSGLEQGLIFLAIVALPTENHFLFIPGFSLQFILFGIIAVYVAWNRFPELLRTVGHPALIAAYLFFTVGFLLEWTHPHHSYDELLRVAQMVIGAVLLASLCRDLPALRMACYGYLAAGLWLSILSFLTSYGTLNAATASDFQQASQLRAMAFEDNPL